MGSHHFTLDRDSFLRSGIYDLLLEVIQLTTHGSEVGFRNMIEKGVQVISFIWGIKIRGEEQD